ncbi:MAG TPA: helix-turn-helix domain-containing protein [Phycisphaerales bacterium]|nr:helix-turn-helix domain-containing protein [Phycisphaerales bacterium]
MESPAPQNPVAEICDYIESHLDEELSLERLSSVANLSKYHFHRQFSASTGVSLHQFIQLMRLKRASYRLVFHQEQTVLEIALEAGFDFPESFARAFKKQFGKSPSQFRKHPEWVDWNKNYLFQVPGDIMNIDIEVIDFPETMVAVKEHQGDPARINDSVGQFIEWRKASGLSPVRTKDTFGVSYGDPKLCEPGEYRFDVCGVVDAEVPENPQGVITKTIPGGRCAKVVYNGSRDRMEDTIYHIYRDWIPENGESLRDYPCFFRYRNFFPEVPEAELVTDIYVPLA